MAARIGLKFGKKFVANAALSIGITIGAIGKTIFDRINKGVDKDILGDENAEVLPSELDGFMERYGLPDPNPTLSYTYHVVGYNMMHKTPSWVVQRLNRDILDGDASRKGCNFKRDSNIPKMFSASNEDFVDSELTKGHLAPAGSFSKSYTLCFIGVYFRRTMRLKFGKIQECFQNIARLKIL